MCVGFGIGARLKPVRQAVTGEIKDTSLREISKNVGKALIAGGAGATGALCKQIGGAVKRDDPWKAHGYFFSFCFGCLFVTLGWLCGYLLDIPGNVPLNQALTRFEQVLFVCLLGILAALAYVLSRLASLGLRSLVDVLQRR